MIHIYIYVLLLVAILSSQNTYPIILIHGFLGWGRDEMSGYYYWGGRMDYEQELRRAGFEVYTVSVGPISTNWDRAIEAFYQIKGGQVDYGNEMGRFGIIQKPKNKQFEGLYPLWDAEHPIHIISHSQGGQTAKMLELLLKQKYDHENSVLLSNNYEGWIKSITTISTPHNGSTLVPILLDVFPFSLSLAPWFGSIDNKTVDNFYNFDLEQWSLEKKHGESFDNFTSRLSKSVLANSKNLCSWDLSPDGSMEFNQNYKEDNNVYYFSFTTSATKQKKNSVYHKPGSAMSFHLWPTAILMGNYSRAVDSTWYENDGIVNSVSMSHPFGSDVVRYVGVPYPGIWNHMDRLNMDHKAVIGHGVSQKENNNIFVLYKDHCALLCLLK